MSLCPASKNFTPPEWGKGLRKSLWTPHTQLTLSLNNFTLRPYPTWTTHNTPQYCTSVNNSSNLHLYIGHMHIHSFVYGHFFSVYFYFITIVIHNYCLFSSLLVYFITLIICCLHCLYFLYWKLLTPRQIPWTWTGKTVRFSACVFFSYLHLRKYFLVLGAMLVNVTVEMNRRDQCDSHVKTKWSCVHSMFSMIWDDNELVSEQMNLQDFTSVWDLLELLTFSNTKGNN